MPDKAYDPTAIGTASGDNWTDAYTTFQAALTGAGAGGRVFSRNSNGANAETYTGNSTQTLTSPGTKTAPTEIYAVKNATTAFPPTSSDLVADKDDADLAEFLNFSGGGAANIDFVGYAYVYGYRFKSGGAIRNSAGDGTWELEENEIDWGNGTTSNRFLITGTTGANQWASIIRAVRCRLANIAQGDKIATSRAGTLEFIECITTGTGHATTSNLIDLGAGRVTAKDCDFSSLTSLNEVFSSGYGSVTGELHHCKMWSGWELAASGVLATEHYKAVQCSSDSDHANPIIAYRDAQEHGIVVEETTVFRNGAVGDGATPYSFKLTPDANSPTEGLVPLYSPWMAVRVATGDTKIEVYVHNTGSDKNNGEVWLETLSPNETAAASNAIRKSQSTRVGLLASTANLTDDTTTWNASANFSQKVSTTIAPDTDGIAHVRIAYAMRNATPDPLYVHPTPAVT